MSFASRGLGGEWGFWMSTGTFMNIHESFSGEDVKGYISIHIALSQVVLEAEKMQEVPNYHTPTHHTPTHIQCSL